MLLPSTLSRSSSRRCRSFINAATVVVDSSTCLPNNYRTTTVTPNLPLYKRPPQEVFSHPHQQSDDVSNSPTINTTDDPFYCAGIRKTAPLLLLQGAEDREITRSNSSIPR
mmetsp:Transcript_17130/g.19705  ORF Transcript_17130/g.19705 Transcript_17130/m.19705 type:complete len:111 (+) Transcript_17130:374-706(+)